MLDYLFSQYATLGRAFLEHLWMVAVVLGLSLAAAAVLTVTAMYSRVWSAFLVNLFSVIYAIPSLALFAILIPATGLGKTTAIIVLILYNQYVLLRNFLAGLRGVDPAMLEAAAGMGMTTLQVLYKIRLPLSLNPLFAGLRLAAVSTIGIATIAATINAGTAFRQTATERCQKTPADKMPFVLKSTRFILIKSGYKTSEGKFSRLILS